MRVFITVLMIATASVFVNTRVIAQQSETKKPPSSVLQGIEERQLDENIPFILLPPGTGGEWRPNELWPGYTQDDLNQNVRLVRPNPDKPFNDDGDRIEFRVPFSNE